MATFEVRILNLIHHLLDFAAKKDHVFKDTESNGYGWERYITAEELRSGSFIEKDTILIQVFLLVH